VVSFSVLLGVLRQRQLGVMSFTTIPHSSRTTCVEYSMDNGHRLSWNSYNWRLIILISTVHDDTVSYLTPHAQHMLILDSHTE
jgi:hypothetical protein